MTAHLTHREATGLIELARAVLEERSLGAAVAIVDEHGELLAFLRTDGCRLPSITIAINKAFTAAREQIATAELGQRSRDERFPMSNFGDVRYVSWGGGVPLLRNGAVIGAIGVSGLPEADDEALAVRAADSINT
jgi:glc operon protein GlcG